MSHAVTTASVRECAHEFIKRGWAPIPIPLMKKAPVAPRWPELRIRPCEVNDYFSLKGSNIGVILGPASGGLVDIDLDCKEALLICEHLLPWTDAVFGRHSAPGSHRLYQCATSEFDERNVVKFADPCTTGDRATLLEVRAGGSGGAQSVVPPSVHPSGEHVTWERFGEPGRVTLNELTSAAARLAAAVLLARAWGGVGERNDFRMALAGTLHRAGWSQERIALFVHCVELAACGENDLGQRKNEVASLFRRVEAGRTCFGFARLSELVGSKVAAQAAEWLGIDAVEPGTSTEDGLTEVSEDAVATVFVERHGNDWRYEHTNNRWFRWCGNAWEEDATKYVENVVRHVVRELTTSEDPQMRRGSRKSTFIKGVLSLAASDHRIAVSHDVWDRDPLLLGTPSSTIDLRSGLVRPSRRDDYITKQASVVPSEHEDCPRWKKFLEDATGGDKDLIRFLRQFCGYCLTGLTTEQILLFIYGPGGNGKSVFLNTVAKVLGDYSVTADMDAFTASKFSRHSTNLARLAGARLVTASETESGKAWNEARVKQLTGGDPIAAQFMRQDYFEFRPQFKLAIVGNHSPALVTVDDAIRRRLRIVGFDRRPAIPDPELERKLLEEAAGIFRWMFNGCLDWQEHGLVTSESVEKTTADYFEAEDLFGQWLEDACAVDKLASYKTETAADLYESWRKFVEAAGEQPGSNKVFAQEMRRRGFTPYRKSKERGYRGIRINRPVAPGIPHEDDWMTDDA